ncbi:MAG: enoyl-CoA hydratase/isomerase family protein [Gammaproteobacteria bacterium]|nr:enoyl-CoA hydratase/isomerase family protein [Gammaproteobacteria bacterium]
MTESVGCWLQPTVAGGQIGVIRLQRSARRNSQTQAMVTVIHQQLDLWQSDPRVMMLWLEGDGDHFCAGGDVLDLANAVARWQRPGWCPAIVDFFAGEYRLMHRLRHWSRPVVAWGDGAVMGGGWGLFASASRRLVTERALLAMPEARIGLFPDVMASCFMTGPSRLCQRRACCRCSRRWRRWRWPPVALITCDSCRRCAGPSSCGHSCSSGRWRHHHYLRR